MAICVLILLDLVFIFHVSLKEEAMACLLYQNERKKKGQKAMAGYPAMSSHWQKLEILP